MADVPSQEPEQQSSAIPIEADQKIAPNNTLLLRPAERLSTVSALDRIHAITTETLRDELPYVPPQILNSIWHETKRLLRTKINEQKIAFIASTSRISLLTLIPEIRNRIWNLLIEPRGLIISRDSDFYRDGRAKRAILIPPPLTQTCKQIRLETLPIHYGMNVFQVDVERAEEPRRRLQRWFRLLAPGTAQMIRKFKVRVEKKHEKCTAETENDHWNCNECFERYAQDLRLAEAGILESARKFDTYKHRPRKSTGVRRGAWSSKDGVAVNGTLLPKEDLY